MKDTGAYKIPEHGLELEPTITARGGPDLVGVEHLARYWWAKELCDRDKAKKVIDMGCGCGYGSRILLESLEVQTLKAIDIRDDARAYAYKHYADPAVDYQPGDADKDWPSYAQGDVNMVVAFELLELLRNRDVFLDLVTRILRPTGVFLLSAHTDLDRMNIQPKGAIIHYDSPMLMRLLRRYFKIVLPGAGGIDTDTENIFPLLKNLDRKLGTKIAHTVIYCSHPIPNP